MPHKKILFIDHDHTLTYSDGLFMQENAREDKKLFSGAIVPLSLLNIHTLKLPNHLSEEEEQKILVEIRMFEEGNLDSNEEYTIDYIRHDLPTENSYLFEVFALSHVKAADYFSESLARSDVIDLIVPAVMIYESLYDTDALPKQNDVFLYLGEEESFAAIYQNGRYIAHRTLDNLSTLAIGSGLDVKAFTELLKERGVLENNCPPEEYEKCTFIQDSLSRNIERLVHTINHKRGLFGLTDINHIYLDFQGNTIPGLKTVFDAYGIQTAEISSLSRPDNPPDELHNLLCAEYLSRHTESPSLNLTPFERKTPWYKRESGKFLAVIAASLLIAFCIPISLSWLIGSEEERKENLTAELAHTEQKTVKLAAMLKERNKHLSHHENELKTLKNEILMVQGTHDTAELITQMHLKRQQMLIDVTAELGRYRLGTLMMEQNGSKEMSLQVVADYRKRNDIARLMSGLYALGYQNVETHAISLDNDMYNAVVKVTR